MIPPWGHLEQSTLFAVVAGLLTLALRKNRARARYWLWLAASLKFLLPFSLLTGVGSHIPWHSGSSSYLSSSLSFLPSASPAQSNRVADAPRPAVSAPTEMPASDFFWLLWVGGSVAVFVLQGLRWRRIYSFKRRAVALHLPFPIRTLSSPDLLEPAVFGVWRPTLLLPEGIERRLTRDQLDAIFAHEHCHVRYRDNLAGVLHMLVEILFWFHPLVWWLGARLIEERERACDEAVLQSGHEPRVYAEGILEVCKLYLASPLACAAGIGGANLKQRMEAILTARIGRKLSLGRKLLLIAAGVTALSLPVLVGMANAPFQTIQSSATYKAVSIKSVTQKPGTRPSVNASPDKFTLHDTSLRQLISAAYHVHDYQISGGPAWANADRFEITANAQGISPFARLDPMHTVLEDRFHLRFHHETKELPVYILKVAKGGPKLARWQPGSCVPFDRNHYDPKLGSHYCGFGRTGVNLYLNTTLDGKGIEIKPTEGGWMGLTGVLSGVLGRMGKDTLVVDQTGLTGLFDLHLEWYLAPSNDPERPSLFNALQQQLGLTLEPGQAPVETLVIDHAERPI